MGRHHAEFVSQTDAAVEASSETAQDQAPEPPAETEPLPALVAVVVVEQVKPPPLPAPAPQTPVQTEPARASPGTAIEVQATHYGVSYAGNTMGCGGIYDPNNPTIVAVGPARYREWPCGTALQVCGAAGCIVVTRQDACPGCHANVIDLSESGNSLVCGGAPHTCRVTIHVLPWPGD
jgi:hypothetical protein